MKRINLLFFLAMCAVGASATVYYVSPEGSGTDGLSWATAYTSPAAALSGSPVAGDEVWVKQGTYVSASTLSWKTGINFYGGFSGTETERAQRSKDASLTILEGTNTNRVLNAPQMASMTIWDGFTIRKGFSSGGGAGIFMQRNAVLSNSIIQDNTTSNWGGGGIYIQGADADSVKVIDCIIRNNTATSTDTRTDKHGGGGIRIRPDASKAVVRNCIIENNTVDGLGNSGSGASGGGIYIAAGTLENSIVRNNIATNKNASTSALSYNGKCQGGGVLVMPQTTAITIAIRNCTITGNKAATSMGGGISIDPFWTSATIISPVIVSNTVISNNYAYKNGGGIMTEGQQAASTAPYSFENVILSNNTTETSQGGGAFINNIGGYSGSISFTNCNIVNNRMNTYNYGGAGIFYNNATAKVTNSVFLGNLNAGTSPLKHHIRTGGVDGNELVNCAFDTRFSTSDVYATTDLTGMVTIETDNSGNEAGKFYADFVAPTDFTGAVITGATDSLDMIADADWSLLPTSALIDAGRTTALTTDITGKARPQNDTYDIGAYEYVPGPATGAQNIVSGLKAYASNGAIIIENEDETLAISIYSITGTLVKTANVPTGSVSIQLPENHFYIVKAGAYKTKILL